MDVIVRRVRLDDEKPCVAATTNPLLKFDYAKNLWAHKKRINGVPISHKPQHMQFSLVKISFQHRQKERQDDRCEDE